MTAADDEQHNSHLNPQISEQTSDISEIEQKQPKQEDKELRRLLLPNVDELPQVPPSSIEANFTTFFATDLMELGHDQYVHRHANGYVLSISLVLIGIIAVCNWFGSTPLGIEGERGIVSVDFNVGKSDRSGIKVTGKRKKNAQRFESNTALCKVFTAEGSYIVRCWLKGSLLEVNDRLIKQPELLNTMVGEFVSSSMAIHSLKLHLCL
ncbi:hypothetical protein SASPL_149905 [Salvia splendens]|uniref:Protein Abitram n=1 Tax=Salvia splendens TaxID=180675 RepID=A0A8X8W592_SALSN|nr:hypothetical protein SASPL_149905 [Salvia splendens]